MRDGLQKLIDDNIGARRMSRLEWINHNTQIVNELFVENDNQLVLIADGTYCFYQKSQNNQFQRHTYRGSKKRHLVKPFVVCAADGTIIDIYGFYAATVNDATIMIDILSKDQHLRDIFLSDDILIADRGFRDCQKELKKKYNINVKLPTCNKVFYHIITITNLIHKQPFCSGIPPSQKQLTKKQSNVSRLVTKVRWVIEARNEHI